MRRITNVSSNWTNRQVILRFLLPITLVGIGVALYLVILPSLGLANPFLLLFPAVMFSALFGGIWGGLLATLISVVVGSYLMEPYGHLWIQSTTEFESLLVFFIGCGMFSLITEAMHRAQLQSQERAKKLTIAIEEKVYAQNNQIKALREAYAIKDQFLSIVSHELRTPLNSINGFGSILEDEIAGPLNQQQHEYLRKMLRGADLLNFLVNNLLDLTQILAGEFTITPSEMNLREVAAGVIDDLKSKAASKGLTLRFEGPDDLPPVLADEIRVVQVLSNLVDNAIKFTPEGGKIWVRACAIGAFLRIEVEDTGVGIVPEDIPKLFKRFSQLDMSATRKAGGTGLGLSISKAIIEAHGGEIGVESTPGKGSTFWFTLPLAGT
ncbi:MAG TPA: hypothetical protein DD435_01320 [Cyanobacteria bacterium UBA8530]|nr:hypothetical protein [Cyanobacteria bacterium UBA8530]